MSTVVARPSNSFIIVVFAMPSDVAGVPSICFEKDTLNLQIPVFPKFNSGSRMMHIDDGDDYTVLMQGSMGWKLLLLSAGLTLNILTG